jgi:hypothetical protein
MIRLDQYHIHLYDQIRPISYADDTQIIIDGSENSIKTSINILNEFSKISGLKVNLNKSELIPLANWSLRP